MNGGSRNFTIIILDWHEALNTSERRDLDLIRVAGLAEFNSRNPLRKDREGQAKPLAGIRYLPLNFRPESVSSLMELDASESRLRRQKEIAEAWPIVEGLLSEMPLGLSVRDTGRGNVAVSDGRALSGESRLALTG